MLAALALVIAFTALARTSRSVRLALRYGTTLGLAVWAVPFGASFLLLRF